MAQNEQINAVQDTTLVVDAAQGVLANDPGATLTPPLGNWQRTAAGGQISFDFTNNGGYTYISAPGFSGTDTVQYTTDNAGTGTLTINVAATALLPFVSVGEQLGARHQLTAGFGQVGNGVATTASTPVALSGGGYVVQVTYLDQAFGQYVDLRTYDANQNLVSVFDPGMAIKGMRVLALPNGGYVIAYGVYSPGDPNDFNDDVLTNYVQRFDAAGHSLSGPTPFDVPGQVEGIPNISALPNGGFVLVEPATAANLQIYAQSFDAAGMAESQQYAIGVTNERFLNVLPNGQIVVFHQESDNNLHLQRYDVHGNPIGGDIQTFNGTEQFQSSSARLAPLANGGFAVTWASTHPTPGSPRREDVQFYTQVVDANGNLVGPTNERDFHFSPIFGAPAGNITPLSNGGFVVYARGPIVNGQTVEEVQTYDANGNPVGAPIEFGAIGTFGATRALVFALPDGGFAIGLQSAVPENHNLLIYDNDGKAVGEVRMHDVGDGTSFSSFVMANLPNGNALILSQAFGTTSSTDDITVQTIRFDTMTPVIQANQTGGTAKFSAALLPVKIYIPDPDGSEIVQSIDVSGVPVGWTLSHPFATATLNAGVWTVTGPGIAHGGAIDLHLTAPFGTTGSGTLSVIAHTIDTDNGSLNQSFPASFDFAHLPVNDPPPFDFNGDGKGDILFQNNDGTAGVWLLDGVNLTSAGGALPNPGSSWKAKDSGDFNGDGKADILWQNDNGTAGVWLMNGTSVLQTGGALANSDPSWKAKEAADFNGDGKADILWQNDNGTAAVWLMDGTSVLQTGGALSNPGPSWHTKAAADFNGDGKADILWQNDNGTAGVWLMDGTNVLSTGGGLNPGSASWHAEAAGDFNGDGKADILWQNADGTPAVWLMDGTNVVSMGGPLSNPGPTWHVKEAIDANGDGKSDILWQNDNGTPAVWLMDGTSVLQTGGALTNPGAAWHIV